MRHTVDEIPEPRDVDQWGQVQNMGIDARNRPFSCSITTRQMKALKKELAESGAPNKSVLVYKRCLEPYLDALVEKHDDSLLPKGTML